METRLSFLCYQIIELQKTHQRYALKLNSEPTKVGSGNTHNQQCLTALALFALPFSKVQELKTQKYQNQDSGKAQ